MRNKGFNKIGFVHIVIITFCALQFSSCSKDSVQSTPDLLLGKWILVSTTIDSPTFPSNFNSYFNDQYSSNDYFLFSKNDSVYSYISEYYPNFDTAYYKQASYSIFFTDKLFAGPFSHQLNNGNFVDTTTFQILSISNNLLVISFPIQEDVTNLAGPGITTYYPGTQVDTLKK
jgi:hypothetical protein